MARKEFLNELQNHIQNDELIPMGESSAGIAELIKTEAGPEEKVIPKLKTIPGFNAVTPKAPTKTPVISDEAEARELVEYMNSRTRRSMGMPIRYDPTMETVPLFMQAPSPTKLRPRKVETVAEPTEEEKQKSREFVFGKHDGNIDLTARPVLVNEDGSISTVSSISVNRGGREYLIPTIGVDANGNAKRMTDEEAIKMFETYGFHLGEFNTPEEADAYAKELSKSQGELYSYENLSSDTLQKIIDRLDAYSNRLTAEYEKKEEEIRSNHIKNMGYPEGNAVIPPIEMTSEETEQLNEIQAKIQETENTRLKVKNEIISKVKQDEKTEKEENKIKNKPDFYAKSQITYETPKVSEKFMYINNMYENDDVTTTPFREDERFKKKYSEYDSLTEDERKVYVYKYNTEGEAAADEYLDSIEYRLNLRYRQKRNEELKELIKSDPAIATAMNVGTVVTAPVRAVAGAVATVGDIVKAATGEYVDPNSGLHAWGNDTRQVRDVTAKEYASDWFGGAGDGNVGRFVYNTMMSMGDSLANMAVGSAVAGAVSSVAGITLSSAQTANIVSGTMSFLMSSDVTEGAVVEGIKKGYSPHKAILLGIARGAVEGLSEKYSLESWMGNPKGILKTTAKAAVAEGSEEIAANWGNRVIDVIEGDKSASMQIYKKHIEAGESVKEAIANTFVDMIGEDASAFLGGMLSGGVMGGTFEGINSAGTYRAGKEAIADGSAQSELEWASENVSDEAIRKKADKYINAFAPKNNRQTSDSVSGIVGKVKDKTAEIKKAYDIGEIIKENVNTSAENKKEMLSLAAEAKKTGTNSEAYAVMLDIVAKSQRGKYITAEDVQSLKGAVRRSVTEIAGGNSFDETVQKGTQASNPGTRVLSVDASKFVSAGLDMKTAEKRSAVLDKLKNGENITNREYLTLDLNSEVTQRVIEDVTGIERAGHEMSEAELREYYGHIAKAYSKKANEYVARVASERKYRAEAEQREAILSKKAQLFTGGGVSEQLARTKAAVLLKIENGHSISNRELGMLDLRSPVTQQALENEMGIAPAGQNATNAQLRTYYLQAFENYRNSTDIQSTVLTSGEDTLQNESAENQPLSMYEIMDELGLTYDEQRAILEYKSSESYIINETLRSDKKLSEAETKFATDLESAIDKFPKYNGIVYRNIGLYTSEQFSAFITNHSVGEIISLKGFTSTSKSKTGYKIPDSVPFKVHYEIETNIGFDVSSIGLSEEQEVLIKHNTKYVVSDITIKGSEAFIEMKGVEENAKSETRNSIDVERPADKLGETGGKDELVEENQENFAKMGSIQRRISHDNSIYETKSEGNRKGDNTKAIQDSGGLRRDDRDESWVQGLLQRGNVDKDTKWRYVIKPKKEVEQAEEKSDSATESVYVDKDGKALMSREEFVANYRKQIGRKGKKRGSASVAYAMYIDDNATVEYGGKRYTKAEFVDAFGGENEIENEAAEVRFEELLEKDGAATDFAGNAVRYSIDTSGNTKKSQSGVMWTVEEKVLTRNEVAAFYEKISEMVNSGYKNYKLSADGEVIFSIRNKLIYTDGNYDYPKITGVITFNTNNTDLIEFAKELVYDGIESGFSVHYAIQIIEIVHGEEFVTWTNYENSRAYERETGRRKGENSRATDQGSREDVSFAGSARYSIDTSGDTKRSQSGVMWTIRDGVLTKKDVALFYREIAKLNHRNSGNYNLSADGDYIFDIENKLIYTDGNYENPVITKVISFNSEYEDECLFAKEVFIDAEENQSSMEDATSIVESFKGEGFVTTTNYEDSRAYEGENGRRKRENSRATDQGSREDVGSAGGSTRYSIEYNNDGTPNTVVIDEDIFKGHENEKPHKVIKEYLKQNIGKFATIIESGQKVYFGKDLPGEYTQSRSTRQLSKYFRDAKNQAAQEIEELIEIASDRQWTPNVKNKHSIGAKYGWYKYSTKFRINDTNYSADMLIRNDADGKKYLYDIINIKRDTTRRGDKSPHQRSAYSSPDISETNVPVDISISQNDTDVNTYNMQKTQKNSRGSARYSIDGKRDVRSRIKYSPKGIKLLKDEYAKFKRAVNTDYRKAYKTHKGLQYQSCVTDKTHILYVYEDSGFDNYNVVARIDYFDVNVANTIMGVLKNGEHYRITEVINFVLKTFEVRRSGYTVYNTCTKKRISSRGDGSVFEGQSQSDTGGVDAGGSGFAGYSGGTDAGGSGFGRDSRGNISYSLEQKKWYPDLSKKKLDILKRIIKNDIKTSTRNITDTANWLFTNIGGTYVFAIYSTEDSAEPTLLYESKGERAESERNILLDILEMKENGKNTFGKPAYVDWVSDSSWLRRGSSVRDSAGTVGRGRGDRDAGVLQGQSRRKSSAAFKSVIKNLFKIQREDRRGSGILERGDSRGDISYSKELSESEDNNERRDLLSDGSSERQNGESTEITASVMAESTERTQKEKRDARDRIRLCDELKKSGKTKRMIIAGHRCEVIPSEQYNDRMRAIEEKNSADGFDETIIVTGGVELPFIKDENGSPKTARGVFIETADGRKIAVVRYDHSVFTPEQINEHEGVHKNYKTARVQKARNIIWNSLSVSERNKILSDVAEDYEGISTDRKEYLIEEFVANTLAGMNEYSQRFAELVNDYQSGGEILDVYKVSEYAESIDGGGSTAVLENISLGNEYSLSDYTPSLMLPKQEYVMVSKAVKTKNTGLTDNELKPVDYVYAANEFYIYENQSIGNFTVIKKLDIDADFERIEVLKGLMEDGVYTNTDRERLNRLIDNVRGRERSDTRNNVRFENRRTAVGDDRILGGQQRSNTSGHSSGVSGDNKIKYSDDTDLKIPYDESVQLREYIISKNHGKGKLKAVDCKEIGDNFYIWKNNSRTDYEVTKQISIIGNEQLIKDLRSEIANGTYGAAEELSRAYERQSENGRGCNNSINAMHKRGTTANGNGGISFEQFSNNRSGRADEGNRNSRHGNKIKYSNGERFLEDVEARIEHTYAGWVYDSITDDEVAVLEKSLFDINYGDKKRFIRTQNGEYIIAANNKLIYTDGKYDSPYISKMIVINSEYETEIDEIRRQIYAIEKGKSSVKNANQIIENTYGLGYTITVTGENYGTDEGFAGRGEGKSGGEVVRNRTKESRRREYNNRIKEAAKKGLKELQQVIADKNSNIRYALDTDGLDRNEYNSGNDGVISEETEAWLKERFGDDTDELKSIIAAERARARAELRERERTEQERKERERLDKAIAKGERFETEKKKGIWKTKSQNESSKVTKAADAELKKAREDRLNAAQKAENEILAEKMSSGRRATTAKRKQADVFAEKWQKEKDKTTDKRKDAKKARRMLRESNKNRSTEIDESNDKVNAVRSITGFDKEKAGKIKKTWQAVKYAGREAYKTFVNSVQEVDNFSKLQDGGVKAGNLVNVARGSASTVGVIVNDGLVDPEGKIIGSKAFKNVILMHDEKGKYSEKLQEILDTYMKLQHTVDRMSIVSRAWSAVEVYENENPWLKEIDPAEFGRIVAQTDAEARKNGTESRREIAKKYMGLLEWASKAKNKPVLGDINGKAISASTAAREAMRIERENPWVKEKAQEIHEYWDRFMRAWAVGVTISEQDYNHMCEIYPHYVPTYRVRDKFFAGAWVQLSLGSMSAGKTIKEAQGSTRQLMNIEDSFAMLISKMIRSYRTNELLLNIIDTVIDDSDGRFADMAIFDAENSEIRESSMLTEADMSVSDSDIDEAEMAFEKIKSGSGDGNVYKIHAWKDGNRLSAETNKELFEGLAFALKKQPYGKGYDIIIRGMNKISSMPKTLITGVNVFFAARNVIRDIQNAVINTEGKSRYFVKYMLKAAYHMRKNSESWITFKALGGTHSEYYMNEKGFAYDIKKANNIFVKNARAVVSMPGKLNEAVEGMTRFAEYLATIDIHGDTYESRTDAIKNSAEVTVDFGRKGKLGGLFNSMMLYWNPAVQGVDKVIRSAFETKEVKRTLKGTAKKLGKTLGRAALISVIPQAVCLAVIHAMGRDDEYEKLSDRVKDAYYVLPHPKDRHKFIKIPKTRDWGVLLATPFMRIVDGMRFGRDEGWFANYVEDSLAASFLPPMLVGWDNEEKQLTSDVFGFELLSDLARNKDFAGRTIIPYQYMDAKLKDQWDEETSILTKTLAQFFEFSPMQVDYILESYCGDYYKIIKRLTAVGNFDKSRGEAKEDWAQIIQSAWIADSRYSNQAVSDYYDKTNRLDETVASLKLNMGDEYQNTKEYKLQKALNMKGGYGYEIQQLNKQARELPDGDEKDDIKAEIAATAVLAIDFYDDVMNGDISDPVTVTAYESSYGKEITKQMAELKSYMKDYSFEPNEPTTKVYTDPKKKNYEYVLTEEQRDKHKEFYREEYIEAANNIIGKPKYKSANAEKRAELLEEAHEIAVEKSKEQLFEWLRNQGVKSTKKKK